MDEQIKYLEMGYSLKAAYILSGRENLGILDCADISIKDVGDCGDKLELYLRVDNGIITDASYRMEGCIGLQLAATILTKLIRGLSLSEAAEISFDTIVSYAEKVPEDKEECINFAINTLRKAISDQNKAELQN